MTVALVDVYCIGVYSTEEVMSTVVLGKSLELSVSIEAV